MKAILSLPFFFFSFLSACTQGSIIVLAYSTAFPKSRCEAELLRCSFFFSSQAGQSRALSYSLQYPPSFFSFRLHHIITRTQQT